MHMTYQEYKNNEVMQMQTQEYLIPAFNLKR